MRDNDWSVVGMIALMFVTLGGLFVLVCELGKRALWGTW